MSKILINEDNIYDITERWKDKACDIWEEGRNITALRACFDEVANEIFNLTKGDNMNMKTITKQETDTFFEAKRSDHDGLHFKKGSWFIWQIRDGWQLAKLESGVFINHSPKADLEQAIVQMLINAKGGK